MVKRPSEFSANITKVYVSMNRRSLVRDAGLFVSGGAGAYVLLETNTVDQIQSDTLGSGDGGIRDSDSTDDDGSNTNSEGRGGEVIKEVQISEPSIHMFSRLRFYDTGRVDIFLVENHPGDRIAFTHSAHNVFNTVYRFWDAPEFEGPINVDLKRVIQNHGPYPSTEFKIALVADENRTMAGVGGPTTFDVPGSFMPE